MTHRYIVLTCLLALICVGTLEPLATAQIGGTSLNYDADLTWRTLTTDHFRVHFHDGLEGVAREVAPIAEDAYTRLRDQFGEAPETIDLVLTDPYDFVNGFANPISDQVVIFTSHRDISESFNVRTDSWWDTIVTHELVHSVDLRQTRGIHDLLERVLGNIIIPNAVKPIPFLEGLAVYEKHRIVGESRMNDSRTRMVVRQMVLDNDFPTWEEILGFYNRDEWPSLGLLVYNYGAWLMAYIEEAHGPDALQRFTDVNARKPLQILALFGFGPRFDEIIQESLGVSPEALYANFKDWLRRQFVPEIDAIREAGVRTGRGLTTHGFWTDDPTWSSNDLIAYTLSSSSRSGLRVMRPNGEWNTEVVSGSASEPAWSPDGRTLVYAKLENVNQQSIRSDLYQVTVQTGSARITASEPMRLSRGERAISPAFAPNGETLYYAKQINHAGHSALMARDMNTGEIRMIRDFSDMGAVVQSLSVSPDGEHIALALWRPGGHQDIYTMPADGTELRAITQSQHEARDPVWSPNGQYVIFSSDLDRRDNLYAVNVDSGDAFRITNALSGAFAPSISPDGEVLAYLGYDGNGYDVYRLPYQPEQWTSVELPESDVPTWDGYPTGTGNVEPYNPIPLMLPKLWIPTPLEGGVGITTLGNDPLLEHIYSVTAGWDFQSQRPIYALNYQYDSTLPLVVSASGNRSQSSIGLNVTVPLEVSFDRDQSLNLGYERLVDRAPSDDEGVESSAEEAMDSDEAEAHAPRTTTTLSGRYAFNAVRQTERFGHSTDVAITGELINVETTGKWHQRVVLDWHESVRLPFPETHRIALDVRGGWTDSPHDAEGFTLGGPTLQTIAMGSGFSVRGFAPNLAEGQQAVVASLQYEFPLFDVKQSVQSWPVFVDDVGGGVGQGLGEGRPRAYIDLQLPGLF